MAGALVGFIFSFIGGNAPDPEILKLQAMIKETQTLIVLGNQEI
jgi:xanthosine utilization system XapX-like protein